MKNRIFITLFITLASVCGLRAQDFIVLKTGIEIKSKIVELTPTEIKYKTYDNLNGPTILIEKNTVFMLRYENGKTEVINPISEQPKTMSVKHPSVQNRQKQILADTNSQNTGLVGGIFIGAALPLGSYASADVMDDEKAAGAKTGFCLGLKVGRKVDKNTSLLLEGQYTRNAYEIKLEDVRNIYTLRGEWRHINILLSSHSELPISTHFSLYGMSSVGVSFASIGGDFADVLEVLNTKTKATSFVYGFGFGCVVQKNINIGIRTMLSNPTFGDFKQDAFNVQATIGYQF